MTLTRLAAGELATMVTYLEMRARAASGPLPASSLTLERRAVPDLDWYRTLFRRVGAPWLWFSRLAMDDRALTDVIHHPAVEIYAVVAPGGEAGFLELDLRTTGACSLAYVALASEHAGQGHGRWLLGAALDLAWRPGIGRVHLQTCTLDHPAAIRAYLRAGFTVSGRAIETFSDPRASGLLAADCAPQIPVFESASETDAPLDESLR